MRRSLTFTIVGVITVPRPGYVDKIAQQGTEILPQLAGVETQFVLGTIGVVLAAI